MAVEYAPQPKNGPKIFLGENHFWSKSGAQNAQNLDFSKIFESYNFQLHHTPEWANSDRNSLKWSILKSERSFEIFEIFEELIILDPDMPKIRPRTHETCEKNRKFFFHRELHLGSLDPSLYLHSSYATPMDLGPKICPENAPKLPLSSVLKSASLF